MPRLLQRYAFFIAFVLLCLLLAATSSAFLGQSNLISLLRTVSLIGIIALGSTFVILTGGIDLSVGSMLALAGVLAAELLNQQHFNTATTVVVVLAVGALLGLGNGLAITKLNVPDFIVTLASLGIIRGLVLVVHQNNIAVRGGNLITDGWFLWFGGGSIYGLPVPLLIFLVLGVLAHLTLRRTRFGVYCYAVGGGGVAARLSGIQVSRVKIQAYMLSAMSASLAGLLLAARFQAAAPEAGTGTEFDVITAIVVGGASLFGGVGSIVGSVLGAGFVTVLNNGLTLWNVPVNYQYIEKGVVILLVVAVDDFFRRRRLAQSIMQRRQHMLARASEQPTASASTPTSPSQQGTQVGSTDLQPPAASSANR